MSARDAIGRSSSERINEDGPGDRQPFLTTYRAVAACTREFGRLIDEVLQGVGAYAMTGIEEKPVVRQSPDRCIVQLGPVALTLAWLQNSRDSVALGELLVVGWRGAVAKRAEYSPERARTGPAALPAKELWADVLVARAADEASWVWHIPGNQEERWSSTELAARCVDRLRLAYTEAVAQ
ncbi:MAG TPA: hypothetical protein VHM30_18275 [Gemmatimonadaceae bacterium]|nr:hypothetical protein [Gemmatimonadaceae bacterium]